FRCKSGRVADVVRRPDLTHRDIGWTEMPQCSSLLPYRGVLSFLSEAREVLSSETSQDHAARRHGGRVATRGARAASDTVYRVSAFRDGLKEAGFIDGHNVAIEFRWAENKRDRLPALAADLAQRQVAVMFGSNISMQAAKAATSTIPIVFVSGGDPIAT